MAVAFDADAALLGERDQMANHGSVERQVRPDLAGLDPAFGDVGDLLLDRTDLGEGLAVVPKAARVDSCRLGLLPVDARLLKLALDLLGNLLVEGQDDG